MNQSEYTYLQTKKWRAIGYDWNVLSTYQPTSRLYCLTDFQVAWLLSNTEYMRWSTRWIDCPCTQDDLDAMKAELEYNLMSCFDLQPYQLDYIYDQIVANQLQGFNDRYDAGGISELNPNTPTDFYSGDDSQARLDALCMACETYVRSYAQRWLQQASLINSALNFFVGIISPVPYINDIAVQVIAGLIGVDQAKVNAMQDNDALDSVTCCMKDGLNGGVVNQTIFEQCLDGCGFLVDSGPYIVQQIIGSDLDLFNNWLTFLNALGDAYTYTQKGIQFACPCDELWEYTKTFDMSLEPFTFYDWGSNWNPQIAGQLRVPDGIEATDIEFTANNNQRRRVTIETLFDSTFITEIELTYTASLVGSPNSAIIAYKDGINVADDFFMTQDSSSEVIETAMINQESNEIYIDLVVGLANPNPPVGSSGLVVTVTIRGTGIKPSQFS